MASMTGARYLAETLHGYGITHFFFMPVIVPIAIPDFGDRPDNDPRGEVRRLHGRRVRAGEKGAGSMAPNRSERSTSPPGCKTPTLDAHRQLP